MKIAIVGTGYVGLVSGACFAEMGLDITCVDIDAEKIEGLNAGVIPIYEPGLEELVRRNVEAGRLHFTTDLTECLPHVEVVFSAVGTPPDEDGSADLKYVLDVARTFGRHIRKYTVLVTKSTVPVGTAQKVRAVIEEELEKRGCKVPFDVASNPEFLKEGAAIKDLYPGCGYGGSCFPKDVKALAHTAREHGYTMQVIEAVERVNEQQKGIVFEKLQTALGDLRGKVVAIWGLAFKPETDDMREAPATVVIDHLLNAGAKVCVYDPVAMPESQRRMAGRPIRYARTMYEAAEGADAVALITEWKEFRMPDWAQLYTAMRGETIVDGRNIFDKPEVIAAGFRYFGIGK